MKNTWFVFFLLSLSVTAMADELINNDIANGCGDAYYYTAVLEPISYNCSAGQFLPAGAISCQSCPQTHTCNGGTYTFNSNQTQGLSAGDILVTDAIGSCSSNFNQSFSAIFEPITYTCLPGYYLPAGDDWLTDNQGCTICPSANKCTGGTYTFNETNAQGIESCPSATPYAPAGSAVCFSSILHLDNTQQNDMIYLKSTSTTSPSLNIDIDDDDVPDGYANMTTIRTPMSNVSNHYLKITVNGVLYYVCDDTSCPGTN